MKPWSICVGLFVEFFALLPTSGLAQDEAKEVLSRGQTLYVPAYSHIYSGDKERPFLLAVTLSIRNVELSGPISLVAVAYHNTKGDLLKRYLDKPITLKALETTRFVVPESDTSGGSGANFIVSWTAENPVNPPIVETIMIGTKSQQGLSFTSRGRVLKLIPPSKEPLQRP